MPPNRIPLDQAILPGDADTGCARTGRHRPHCGVRARRRDQTPVRHLPAGNWPAGGHPLPPSNGSRGRTPTCRTRCSLSTAAKSSTVFGRLAGGGCAARRSAHGDSLGGTTRADAGGLARGILLGGGGCAGGRAGDAVRQLAERFDPRHYRIDLRAAPLMRAFAARDEARSRGCGCS